MTKLLCLLLLGGWLYSPLQAQNEITYGFVQDAANPLFVTAVAYPNFTSTNVTISTATFSFLLPEGTITDPAIPVLPANGAFLDTPGTGNWTVEKLTPSIYGSAGLDPNDLEGNDVYRAALSNSPSPNATSGVAIPLFSFLLPQDCMNGNLEVLTNNGSIQQAILNSLNVNYNNQMAVSVNDAPTSNIYTGNDPTTFSYGCPLLMLITAVDDSVTVDEDMSLVIMPLDNDDFGSAGPAMASVSIIVPATIGMATVNDGGTPNDPTDDTILYVPNMDVSGPDSLDYQICDLDNVCDTARIYIGITPINDAPLAVDDVYTTDEDTQLDANVTANDSDVDGPDMAITLLDNVDNGTLSLNTDGDFTYLPDANFVGTDSFQYVYCDLGTPNLCDTATATITIETINDPPIITDGGIEVDTLFVTIPEDMSDTTCVTVTDADLGLGDMLTCTLSVPANGTATLLNDTCIVFTPSLDFNGSDMVSKYACDANGACDTVVIVYDVTPVNDAPLAVDDNYPTPEDTQLMDNVADNDSDVDGPAVSIALLDNVDNGTLSLATDGSFTYTPDPDFVGNDTFQYQYCDLGTPNLCDTATATIMVEFLNDPPVITEGGVEVDTIFVTVAEDTPDTTCVTVTDPDEGLGDMVTCTLSTPVNGTATLLNDTCIVFSPSLDYNGPEIISKYACDTNGACDTVVVVYDVTPVNDAPLAGDDTFTTDEETQLIDNVTGNDSDVDGPDTDIALLDATDNGSLTLNQDGGFAYTPDPDFSGDDTFQYQYCDLGTPGLCDTATVTITVTPVNDPPVILVDGTPMDTVTVTLMEDMSDTTCVSIIDPDLGAMESITCTINLPTNGMATLVNDTCIAYTPDPDYAGMDLIRKVACDAGGACDTVYILYDVLPVNDAPEVLDDPFTMSEGETLSNDVTGNDTDVDGPAVTITVLDDVSNGTLSMEPDGTFDYTPDFDYVGMDSFTYSYCDGGTPNLCDTAQVQMTIDPLYVNLAAKVLLQGALLELDTATVAMNDTLMRDDLRRQGHIPLIEPYSELDSFMHAGAGGGETIADSATVLDDYGSDAIVDWVLVELRDANDPTTVLDTRAGLVQRDGDIVDVDGTNSMRFRQSVAGSYYVAVRHRNHLGTMTADPLPLTPMGSTVDFRDTTLALWHNEAPFDGSEQIRIADKFALWAGNSLADRQVVFAGQNNERVSMFNAVLFAPGNVLSSNSYIYPGYHPGDIDMNGAAILDGELNDVDPIFNNVDAHPVNAFFRSQLFQIREQLPNSQ